MFSGYTNAVRNSVGVDVGVAEVPAAEVPAAEVPAAEVAIGLPRDSSSSVLCETTVPDLTSNVSDVAFGDVSTHLQPTGGSRLPSSQLSAPSAENISYTCHADIPDGRQDGAPDEVLPGACELRMEDLDFISPNTSETSLYNYPADWLVWCGTYEPSENNCIDDVDMSSGDEVYCENDSSIPPDGMESDDECER
eukprot:GHVQ01042580.1.p1 GENE.GHVQ01042580.1~~GHVQ01042580.1.p1  ORF type:complete len:194 (-),score=43.89 GHVQ01042580.1:547-1128(-)